MDWNKVAAIGQVAGAIATFAAVVVSLAMARVDRRVSLRISVGRRIVKGGGLRTPVHLITFSIVNTGTRMARINTLGWRTGWPSRWLPTSMRRRYAIQMTERPGQRRLPFDLQPGENESIGVDEADYLEKINDDFFARKLPWPIRSFTTPIYGMVATSIDTKFVRVEPDLPLFLSQTPPL